MDLHIFVEPHEDSGEEREMAFLRAERDLLRHGSLYGGSSLSGVTCNGVGDGRHDSRSNLGKVEGKGRPKVTPPKRRLL